MKAVIVTSQRVWLCGSEYMPLVRLCADSAVGRDVMPLFVPDLPLDWYGKVCLALRIGRLGKHVPERFALRYIDAVGAVCVLCAKDASFYGSGLHAIIDSAVTTGAFVPLADDAAALQVEVDSYISPSVSVKDLGRVVADVSKYTTLKSGDLLVLDYVAVCLPLVPDKYIDASVCGVPSLHLKVK